MTVMIMMMMMSMMMIIMMISGRDIGNTSWPPSPPGESTSGTSWAGPGPSERTQQWSVEHRVLVNIAIVEKLREDIAIYCKLLISEKYSLVFVSRFMWNIVL